MPVSFKILFKSNFIQKDDVNGVHPTMWIYALKIRVIGYFDFAETFSSFMLIQFP